MFINWVRPALLLPFSIPLIASQAAHIRLCGLTVKNFLACVTVYYSRVDAEII